MPTRTDVWIATASLLLCVWTAGAQVRETVEVAVTNVDLIVTDAKGNPVRGLTKDEFEILEGGKRREITNFSEVSAALPAAGTTASTMPAPSRAVLLLFDNTTLTLANRRRAADAVEEWVAGHLRPIDRIAVVTANPALHVTQDWTVDSRAATTAIEKVAAESPSASEQQRRETRLRVDEVVHRARTAGPNEPVQFEDATQAVRVYAAGALRDAAALLGTVRAAMTHFPPNAQKKVMLIVGEGISTNPGSEMFQYLNTVKMSIETESGSALLKAGARTATPLSEAFEYDMAPTLRAVSSAAVRDGVLIYAMNPGQNENTAGQVMETAPSDVRTQFSNADGNRAGYELLVRTTGGSAFYGAPPAVALSQMSNDLDEFYSLGFRTGSAAESNGPLAVKSKSRYRVRAVRAAAPQSSDDRMRESVLANHLATPASNDLKIVLASDAPVIEGDRRKVRLKIMIPVESLRFEREGEEVVGGFAVYVSSGDDRGTATPVNRQEHHLRWPAAALETSRGKKISYVVEVLVPAGLTQISVGVIDERSQQTGFDRLAL